MSDPFLIDGPAVISCSFGRTSGYLLWRILQSHGGNLPSNVHVLFENTGKEDPATLDFGHRMETEWNVPITWLEYERRYFPAYRSEDRKAAATLGRLACGHVYEEAQGRSEPGFRVVNYETASRNGEPFHNLIDLMALPSLHLRLCTNEMKIKVAKKYMMSLGYDRWDNIIGLRYDEPRRVSKRRDSEGQAISNGQRWTDEMPLDTAKITKADVNAFWQSQPFDLALPLDANGDTVAGNCDMCFLKSTAKRSALIQSQPERLAWWEEQEERTGMTFRPNGASFKLLRLKTLTPEACALEDGTDDCNCFD